MSLTLERGDNPSNANVLPGTDTNPAKSHDEKRILSSERSWAGRDHLNTNTLHATNCKIENQGEGEKRNTGNVTDPGPAPA